MSELERLLPVAVPLSIPDGDDIRASFITGSYCYGTPTAESDIDLVMLVDVGMACFLTAANDIQPARDAAPRRAKYGFLSSLRFGRLNILLCTCENEYDCWREGTLLLFEERRVSGPVSRERASSHTVLFAQSRKHVNGIGNHRICSTTNHPNRCRCPTNGKSIRYDRVGNAPRVVENRG